MKFIIFIVLVILLLINFKSVYSNNNNNNFDYYDNSNNNKLVQGNIIENGLPSISDYSKFVLGFIEGVGINITNEQSVCFKRENGSISDLKTGVLSLQNGLATTNLPNMTYGVVKIGHVLLEIPVTLKDCGITDKVVQITYIGTSFISGPAGIVTFILRELFNTLVNSGTIIDNLTGIFIGLQTGDYYKLGMNLGSLINIIMIKQ